MSDRLDVVALAKRINQRREEYNRAHTEKVVITPVMSRILENDPDYVPYRPRAAGKTYRPSTNPTVASVVDIARRLETTVGDLLGEAPVQVTVDDLRRMRAFVDFVRDRFGPP